MTTFLFAYRAPKDYEPGNPDAMAAWGEYFAGIGDGVIDAGNPIFESVTLGDCGTDTNLGGYSLIKADNLEDAIALAKKSPAMARAGVEVGVVTEIM
jgi:hypothetical protein